MTLRQKTVRYGLPTVQCNNAFDAVYVDLLGTNVSYTDSTTNAKDTTGTGDVFLGNSLSSLFYFGVTGPEKFSGLYIDMQTASTATSKAWEYYTGSSWAQYQNNLTVFAGATTLNADTGLWFNQPTNWEATAVNGVTGYYFRVRATTGSLTGTLNYIRCARDTYLAGDGTTGTSLTVYLDELGRIYKSAFLRIIHTNPYNVATDLVRINATVSSAGATYPLNSAYLSSTSIGTAAGTNTTEYLIDMTSLFNSYGTTNSNTEKIIVSCCSTERTMTNDGLQNASLWGGELFLTYEYNDATQIRETNTVILPFDAATGSISNNSAQPTVIGSTYEFPALTGTTGILKESGITIQDLYFVFSGSLSETATGTYSLISKFDSGSTYLMPRQAPFDVTFRSLAARNCHLNLIWGGLTNYVSSLEIPHTLYCYTTNSSNRFNNLGGYLVATYSFDANSSKRTITNISHDVLSDDHYIPTPTGNTININNDVIPLKTKAKFNIQEQNPVLVQSGVVYNWQSLSGGTYSISIGNKNMSVLYGVIGNPINNHEITARLDSGGTGMTGAINASGITLSRGFFEIPIYFHTFSRGDGFGNVNATTYLTYYYDVISNKQTTNTYYIGRQTPTSVAATYTNNLRIPFSNGTTSDFWLDKINLQFKLIDASTMSLNKISLSRGLSAGYYIPTTKCFRTGGSIVYQNFFFDIDDYYKNYSNDLSDKINPVLNTFFIQNNSSTRSAFLYFSRYHDYGYTISGNIYGADAGETVSIQAYSTYLKNFRAIGTTERSGNGAYSFRWYDNEDTCFVTGTTPNKYGKTPKLTPDGPTSFDIYLRGEKAFGA